MINERPIGAFLDKEVGVCQLQFLLKKTQKPLLDLEVNKKILSVLKVEVLIVGLN